ncbi:MAG: helix-turn-helix transcriptional regulator [Leucobacter sp.]
MKKIADSESRRASTGRAHSPTRETLLRLLEEQRSPVSISALAKATGWHGNTVRGHLTALWEDGYLNRSRDDARSTQGRPSWLWSATHRLPGEPYAALAGVLAETLARLSPAPERDAREAGRSWGLALGAQLPAAASPEDARRRVVEVMRDQGFAPRRLTRAGEANGTGGADGTDEAGQAEPPDGTEIALRQCPLIEAAAHHPEVVCSVHLGMVTGVLEAIGSADEGSELTPFSAPGECALRLRVAG